MQDEKFEEDGTRKSETSEAEPIQLDETASNNKQQDDKKDQNSDSSQSKPNDPQSSGHIAAEKSEDSGGKSGNISGKSAGDASPGQETLERRICWDVARLHIIEVLSFAVQHHGHRFKYYVMRHPAVPRVLKLVRHKDKYLALAAVRFLRYVCMYVCVYMCVCVFTHVFGY